MITVQQLPSDLKRLDVDYSDQLRLIGYRMLETPTRTDAVEFTLYWQCLKPIAADYSVFAIVYGRQLQEVGKRDAYPYHGLYATRQCRPGQVFADPYRIPVDRQAARPALLRAQIGLKDWTDNVELAPTIGEQPVSAVVVEVGKLGPRSEEQPATMDYRFGESIALLDARLGTVDMTTHLTLTWQALAPPQQPYTVFIHFLNAAGEIIGQADSPPLGGDYPTNWWSAGETIIDVRPLVVPPGADSVTIGLYRLDDGARLPIVKASGEHVPNDELVIPIRP
jgi:hypothetical protein